MTFVLFHGVVGTVGGGFVHAGLFLVCNLYVLRRASKGILLEPLRALVPSLVGVVTLAGFSLWHYLESWTDGLTYQGVLYGVIDGALNLLTVGALMATSFHLSHRAVSVRMGMIYNFCIHTAMLFVLFPYLGETP